MKIILYILGLIAVSVGSSIIKNKLQNYDNRKNVHSGRNRKYIIT